MVDGAGGTEESCEARVFHFAREGAPLLGQRVRVVRRHRLGAFVSLGIVAFHLRTAFASRVSSAALLFV
jgi:hypothetical protein